MRITTRTSSSGFIELKVDEIEATIFKNGTESLETINNLLSVIEDICKLTDRSFDYKLEDIY